jgi:hypothetical protein
MAQGSKVGATSQNTHRRQRQDILNEKRRQTVNICGESLHFWSFMEKFHTLDRVPRIKTQGSHK